MNDQENGGRRPTISMFKVLEIFTEGGKSGESQKKMGITLKLIIYFCCCFKTRIQWYTVRSPLR